MQRASGAKLARSFVISNMTRLRPQLCGCVFLFDGVDANGRSVLVKMENVCPRHALLGGLHNQIHNRICEEGELHNDVIAAVKNELPKLSEGEISSACAIAGDGVMEVDLPISVQKKNKIKNDIDVKHPVDKVRFK